MTMPPESLTPSPDSERDELLPCPFCGHDPVLRETVEHYKGSVDGPAGCYTSWFHIACDQCGFELGDEYQSGALSAWNRRASLSEYAQSPAGFLLVGKADFHMSAEMDVCIGDELFIRRTRPAAPGAGQEPEPVAWRVRGYNQFKTGTPRPWRYFDGPEQPKVNDPDCCDMEPLYAGLAQSKQEPELLRKAMDALDLAARQNEHDMLMTGEECRRCAAVVSEIQEKLSQAAAISQSKQATPPACEWWKDDDGIWKSACGKVTAWTFDDGGPAENGCRFCHGCGRAIAPPTGAGTPPNAPPNASGCDFCRNPLFAGTKCKNCGRNTPPNSEGTASSTRQAPVKQADCKCPQGMYCRHRARIEGNSEGTGTNGVGGTDGR
jgi:Lar family restriction alleviation protein